ncbi:MAG: tetratricopeptide repeat protein [Bernardetiaceae bacterium]|jgi:tetratricopeptide (TPR) repeat protein|nr:tetratricopeptide repeat protein [Bernardetiaceae bacterium]
MKKLVLSLAVAFVATASFAQKEDKEVAKKAKEDYKAAEAAFKAKDYKTAIAKVDESFASEKYKADVKAWLFRADAFAEMAVADTASKDDKVVEGYLAEINKSLNQANELDKKMAPVTIDPKRQNLYARFFNYGVNRYNDNDIPMAARGFRRAHFAKPTDSTALIYSIYAESALDDEKDKTKLAYYANEMIKQNYKVATPYLVLFEQYMNEEKLDKAGEVLAQARKIAPSDKNLAAQQINYYIKTNRIADAIVDMEKAAASATDSKEKFTYLLNLGILQEQAKDMDKAEKAYKEAVALEPNNDDAVYSLGAFYYNKGVSIKKEADNMQLEEYKVKGEAVLAKAKPFFAQSLPFFLKSLPNKPTSIERLNAILSAYTVLGEPEKAVPLFITAVKAESSNPDLLQGLVQACDRSGKMAEAEPFVRTNVAKNPTNAEALSQLLYVYQKMDKEANVRTNVPKARQFFEAARKEDPNNVEILEGLSTIYYTLNMKKEADELEKQITKLKK